MEVPIAMKIGLIADSHIPEAMPELPSQVRTVFKGMDLILHAGDLHCIEVLDWLEEIAPVLACRGNGDEGSGGRAVVPDDPRLHETAVTVQSINPSLRRASYNPTVIGGEETHPGAASD